MQLQVGWSFIQYFPIFFFFLNNELFGVGHISVGGGCGINRVLTLWPCVGPERISFWGQWPKPYCPATLKIGAQKSWLKKSKSKTEKKMSLVSVWSHHPTTQLQLIDWVRVNMLCLSRSMCLKLNSCTKHTIKNTGTHSTLLQLTRSRI